MTLQHQREIETKDEVPELHLSPVTREQYDEGLDDLRGPSIVPPVGGDYDAFMVHVKLLANPVLASVDEALMFIMPTPKQLEYIMRILPLGTYQLTAEAGWWEVYLDELRPRRRRLVNAIEDWGRASGREQDYLPLTRREAIIELSQLEKRIRELQGNVDKHRDKGHYWSAKPLIEFMNQGPQERQGYGFEHLLPPILRETMQALYAAMPDGIGYANRQAIGSQQMMDMFQTSNFSNVEAVKRGRFRPPKMTPPKGRSAV